MYSKTLAYLKYADFQEKCIETIEYDISKCFTPSY